MADRNRSLLMPFLIGVVVVVILFLGVTLIPVTDCEECDGMGFLSVIGAEAPGPPGSRYVSMPECLWCDGSLKRPLWDLWTPEYPSID